MRDQAAPGAESRRHSGPCRRRAYHLSRFHQHVRLSFGPEAEEVVRGLDRLAELIADAA